jgi:hypothetical protein
MATLFHVEQGSTPLGFQVRIKTVKKKQGLFKPVFAGGRRTESPENFPMFHVEQGKQPNFLPLQHVSRI